MNKFQNIILAGALGDAFGYLVEFDSWEKIKYKFGENGILFKYLTQDINCSDDTQMSLFLLEAINNYNVTTFVSDDFKEYMHESFYAWFKTQVGNIASETILEQRRRVEKTNWIKNLEDNNLINNQLNRKDFQLLTYSPMWKKMAPGRTCLDALGSGVWGSVNIPINDSMG